MEKPDFKRGIGRKSPVYVWRAGRKRGTAMPKGSDAFTVLLKRADGYSPGTVKKTVRRNHSGCRKKAKPFALRRKGYSVKEYTGRSKEAGRNAGN